MARDAAQAQAAAVQPKQSPAALRQRMVQLLLPEVVVWGEARVSEPQARQKSAELPVFLERLRQIVRAVQRPLASAQASAALRAEALAELPEVQRPGARRWEAALLDVAEARQLPSAA